MLSEIKKTVCKDVGDRIAKHLCFLFVNVFS